MTNDSESPNKAIDLAIKKLMRKIDSEPTDTAIKIINSAVAWEKAKHAIMDREDSFDPDNL